MHPLPSPEEKFGISVNDLHIPSTIGSLRLLVKDFDSILVLNKGGRLEKAKRPVTPALASGSQKSRRATLSEVATHAGVSIASASRVLNSIGYTSMKMQARVLDSAAELGYQSNLLWSGLRNGSTKTIGIVVRDITSHHWGEIALAAEQFSQAKGFSVILANSQGNDEIEYRLITLLDGRRIDGLIIAPTLIDDPKMKKLLLKLRIPFVIIDRIPSEPLKASIILLNHRKSARALGNRLADLGHKNIAFISPPSSFRPAYEMIDELTLIGNKKNFELQVYPGSFSAEHGRVSTEAILNSSPRPTAIIIGMNQMIPGVFEALSREKVSIPKEMSIIIVEDLPILSTLTPKYDVITRNSRLVGESAASLLFGLLEGKPTETIEIETNYLIRESTAKAF